MKRDDPVPPSRNSAKVPHVLSSPGIPEYGSTSSNRPIYNNKPACDSLQQSFALEMHMQSMFPGVESRPDARAVVGLGLHFRHSITHSRTLPSRS